MMYIYGVLEIGFETKDSLDKINDKIKSIGNPTVLKWNSPKDIALSEVRLSAYTSEDDMKDFMLKFTGSFEGYGTKDTTRIATDIFSSVDSMEKLVNMYTLLNEEQDLLRIRVVNPTAVKDCEVRLELEILKDIDYLLVVPCGRLQHLYVKYPTNSRIATVHKHSDVEFEGRYLDSFVLEPKANKTR